MGLNVSTTMGFENKQDLRNTAKNILVNSGASQESAKRLIDSSIFDSKFGYTNSQLQIIKSSTQISTNNSLNESLKNLKKELSKNNQNHFLGELWEIKETTNKNSEKNPYRDELFDYVIKKDVKNIFAS